MFIRFEEKPEGELILLRLYGSLPEVRIPERIEEKPVTGLAPYAFSEKEPTAKDTSSENLYEVSSAGNAPADDTGRSLRERLDREIVSGLITPLAGEFITSVYLPDSLKSIGELCFYQCRKLKKISLGSGEIEIGGDAFMNCRSLSTIELRASSDQPTSLRKILAQRTSETDVWFTDAAVHFPEYSEKYDLIGPAHIFELNIEGEGFRARKCFEGETFSLPMYDEVFRRAAQKDRVRMDRASVSDQSGEPSGQRPEETGEDERTMCRMAALRLCRPGGAADLSEEAGEVYRIYLLSHMDAFLDELIRQRDLSVFLQLGEQGILEKDHITLCLKKLTAARWVEGTRQVLGMNILESLRCL